MSDDGTSPIEPRKIPFWKTIFQSFRFVFINLLAVGTIGWLPFIITFVASYVVMAELVGYATFSSVITVPVQILSWLAYAVFAVCWHRFVILGEYSGAATGWLAWRNLIFLAYFAVFIGGPSLVIGQLGQYIGHATSQNLPPLLVLGGVVLMFVGTIGLVVMYRFYLLFPATAIDRRLKIGESWQRMRGNTWRLIGATLLVGLIFTVPLLPLTFELGELTVEAASAKARGVRFDGSLPVYVIVSPFVYFLMVAVVITVLSRTYLHIMGGPGQETTTAT